MISSPTDSTDCTLTVPAEGWNIGSFPGLPTLACAVCCLFIPDRKWMEGQLPAKPPQGNLRIRSFIPNPPQMERRLLLSACLYLAGLRQVLQKGFLLSGQLFSAFFFFLVFLFICFCFGKGHQVSLRRVLLLLLTLLGWRCLRSPFQDTQETINKNKKVTNLFFLNSQGLLEVYLLDYILQNFLMLVWSVFVKDF